MGRSWRSRYRGAVLDKQLPPPPYNAMDRDDITIPKYNDNVDYHHLPPWPEVRGGKGAKYLQLGNAEYSSTSSLMSQSSSLIFRSISNAKDNRYSTGGQQLKRSVSQNSKPLTEEQQDEDGPQKKKNIIDVMSDFADKTSFQAMPYIKESGHWYTRLIWILVFTSALGAWIFHSYFLATSYFVYGTTSTVSISYDTLEFPSVTICNINPIRDRMLSEGYASDELVTFFASLVPPTDFQSTLPSEREQNQQNEQQNQQNEQQNQQNQQQGQPPSRRRKRQIGASVNTQSPGPVLVITPTPVLSPVTTPAPVPSPVTTPAPIPSPVITPAPVLSAVTTQAPVLSPVNTPAPVSSQVSTPSPISSPVNTPTPVPSPVTTTAQVQSPVTTPAPVLSPVTTPAPVPSPVNTPVPVQSPVVTPVPVPSPVTTQVPVPLPVTTPAPVPSPVVTPVPVPSPVTTPVLVPSPVVTPVPVPSPVTTPVPVLSPVTTPATVPSPVTTPVPVQSPVVTPVPVPSPVTTPAPVHSPVVTPVPVPSPVPTPAQVPSPVTTPAPVPYPVTTSALVQSPVVTPAPVPSLVTTPALVLSPVNTQVPGSFPVNTPSLVSSPVTTPAPVPSSVITPSPVSSPVTTPAPVLSPITTPAPVPSPVTTPAPVPSPVTTQAPVLSPITTPAPVPSPVTTPGLVPPDNSRLAPVSGPQSSNLEVLYASAPELDVTQFGSGNISQTLSTEADFKLLYANISLDNRTAMAHQAQSMVLGCSFNGKECSYENFTHYISLDYGNCFTFNSAYDIERNSSLKSTSSGALYGLDLTLYIEEHEYITGFRGGRGVRLAIHTHNTLPNVLESSLSLAPGFHTYAGMKMINSSRLGGKFGACGDDGSFENYFHTVYTKQACVDTCVDRTVVEKCGCITQNHNENDSGDTNLLPRCYLDYNDSVACEAYYQALFLVGQLSCNCNQACMNIEYDMQLSYNKWPHSSIFYTLVDILCNGADETQCEYIRRLSMSDSETIQTFVEKNFLKLSLYYRDLNFEQVTQQEEYPTSQFVSDFGGCIGLWVGASAITAIELLDLFFKCCGFCCCEKKRDPKQASKNSNNRPGQQQQQLYYRNNNLDKNVNVMYGEQMHCGFNINEQQRLRRTPHTNFA